MIILPYIPNVAAVSDVEPDVVPPTWPRWVFLHLHLVATILVLHLLSFGLDPNATTN